MYLTALDFGTSQIKVLIAEAKKENQLRVVSAFKVSNNGLRKGEVIDAEDATQSLRQVFDDIKQINKGALKNIFNR